MKAAWFRPKPELVQPVVALIHAELAGRDHEAAELTARIQRNIEELGA